MDASSLFGLGAVVILVLLNGFFVATEFSIVAVRRSRLDQLVQEGYASARDARDVVGHLDSYIAATQLGITLSSLALGWIGEPALAHLLDPLMVPLFGGFAPAAAHGVAIAVAFAIITVLHIVIGELAPKGLALQYPEGTSLWVARPIKLFYAIFRWPVIVLNGVGNGALRLLGLPPASGHEMVHSVAELRMLVTGMEQHGVVEASEARIATRAFQFADLNAGALMSPRTELDALAVTSGRDEVLRVVHESGHNRLPVYQDSLDNIVGMLHVRDLLGAIDQPSFDLHRLARPVMRVPATKPADDLLDEMRSARQHVAVVVDEFGGTAGVVTLEDLIAGLVGRIDEESGPGEPVAAGPLRPEPEADGSLLLDGLTRLDELEELIGLRLDESAHDAADTLGGLVMALLERIPEMGEEAVVLRYRLRVEERDGLRVARVRVLPPTAAHAAAAESAAV